VDCVEKDLSKTGIKTVYPSSEKTSGITLSNVGDNREQRREVVALASMSYNAIKALFSESKTHQST